MTLTLSDVDRGDRVVVTLANTDGETEERAGEVTGIDERRIRIEPDAGIVTRIRVGVDGAGQPGGAEVVTSHRELVREVADLEFEE